MDSTSTDRHLTWILLVFSKPIMLEKTLKKNKRWCKNIITCLKEFILCKELVKKLNQNLNFEIRTFYRYIDLYRAYFRDTLTFKECYYTTSLKMLEK